MGLKSLIRDVINAAQSPEIRTTVGLQIAFQ